jgi:hypothetical protein
MRVISKVERTLSVRQEPGGSHPFGPDDRRTSRPAGDSDSSACESWPPLGASTRQESPVRRSGESERLVGDLVGQVAHQRADREVLVDNDHDCSKLSVVD